MLDAAAIVWIAVCLLSIPACIALRRMGSR
jgi:hypothetical protein